MSYHFCLSSITSLALLDTGADHFLVSTCFSCIAKLALVPSRVQRVEVSDNCTLPVLHEMMSFIISISNLTRALRSPFMEVEGFEIVQGLVKLRQNKPHVIRATSTLTVSQKVVHQKVYPSHWIS